MSQMEVITFDFSRRELNLMIAHCSQCFSWV